MAELTDSRRKKIDFSSWYRNNAINYNKIKVGGKTLRDDAFLNVDAMGAIRSNRPITKEMVKKVIATKDYKQARAISDFYFDKSGIYERLIKYMAHFF